MAKKYGIDWQMMDRAVGEYTTIHPLAMIADYIQNHPELDYKVIGDIWESGAMLMNPDYTVEAAHNLFTLTGVKTVIWLHFWIMWESRNEDE